jgi:hypothetical protein
MVERTAVGEAASSPQPPEAGVRRARLYGVLSAAENRHRQTMRRACGAGLPIRRADPASADFEYVIDLPLTAGRSLAALLRGLTLLLADEGKSGA